MLQSRPNATVGHLDTFAPHATTALIRLTIRLLVPSGRYADIVALFEGRTTIDTIRQWRHGRGKAPSWAIDICLRRLAPITEAMEHARAAPRERRHAPNIKIWNAREKKARS